MGSIIKCVLLYFVSIEYWTIGVWSSETVHDPVHYVCLYLDCSKCVLCTC